jgi:hypothetical protein
MLCLSHDAAVHGPLPTRSFERHARDIKVPAKLWFREVESWIACHKLCLRRDYVTSAALFLLSRHADGLNADPDRRKDSRRNIGARDSVGVRIFG